jgi:aminoglycoside 3-N-acetyltransferase I
MDIQIEKLNPRDIVKFTALIKLFEEVFEMKNFSMPEENYLQQLLAKDEFFVFVAMQDSTVVGGLTSYIMQQYYSTRPLVYIFDLAVKTAMQRRGIGRMLIGANNSYSSSIGGGGGDGTGRRGRRVCHRFLSFNRRDRAKGYSF